MSVLFRTELTRFEYAATGTSYGGVVDFLIVKGPPASISKHEILLGFALLTRSSSAQNFYSADLSSRLRTQISQYGQTLLVKHFLLLSAGRGAQLRCMFAPATRMGIF